MSSTPTAVHERPAATGRVQVVGYGRSDGELPSPVSERRSSAVTSSIVRFPPPHAPPLGTPVRADSTPACTSTSRYTRRSSTSRH